MLHAGLEGTIVAMADPAENPSEQAQLTRLARHQAQSLEHLKNDSQWMRGRVESIDQFLTTEVAKTNAELRSISAKLWHLTLIAYAWSIMAIIGFLISLVSGPRF